MMGNFSELLSKAKTVPSVSEMFNSRLINPNLEFIKLRIQANLSEEVLAEKAGVSIRTIHLLNNNKEIPGDELARILDVLENECRIHYESTARPTRFSRLVEAIQRGELTIDNNPRIVHEMNSLEFK